MVAALHLLRARAAPSVTRVALSRAVAAHEAHEPGAGGVLRRRAGAARPEPDRTGWMARDGRSQLGLRARRALDLAARDRHAGGARGVAGCRARPPEDRRANDPLGGQRRVIAEWSPSPHRRAHGAPGAG